MIPYGRQDITEEDIQSVVDILRSDFLTQGNTTNIFESRLATYCHAKYAIVTNSATSALHLSCLALDLQAGDYVWTSSISFVASSNCALYCGAQIDFIDIELSTGNICINSLENKLIKASAVNKLPKIVIAVHMAGNSCDMVALHQLSLKYGFKIIEDASHAIGARYLDQPVGNCQFSDITVFSFHPVKIITTGEGGCATTNNNLLAKKMAMLRSHGITRDKKEMLIPSDQEWYYEQILLGYNYRLTDIQAALGISQMNRVDDYVLKRNAIANIYTHGLKGLPVEPPSITQHAYSSYHLYIIRIQPNLVAKSRDEVFSQLRNLGIGVNFHYIPIFMQPYYQKFGLDPKDFPNACAYYKQAISLPIFPRLTDIDQNYIIASASKVLLKN